MRATTRRQMKSALQNFPVRKRRTTTPAAGYTKAELEEFKLAMEEMASQIRQDIRAHNRILDTNTQSREEQSQAAYFLNRQSELLRHVESAMTRIRMGVFGVCVGCGEKIEKERLLAVPHTQLCVDCKNRGRSARRITAMSTTQ